jgi:RNA polymerase sigma-70 factor (ECF subfamily)
MTETDRIVAQVLAGQTDAYEEIIHLYESDVRRIVGVLFEDRGTTADLVQEVFVSAYFYLRRYERGRDFGLWIRSIARNRVRKEMRRRSREDRRLRYYRDHVARRFEDDGREDLHQSRLAEAHRRCREELPEHSGEILDLRYGRSLTVDQIASALGRSKEAVKQLLYRVRLLLRDCIGRRMAEA